jgi:hypothetical protein
LGVDTVACMQLHPTHLPTCRAPPPPCGDNTQRACVATSIASRSLEKVPSQDAHEMLAVVAWWRGSPLLRAASCVVAAPSGHCMGAAHLSSSAPQPEDAEAAHTSREEFRQHVRGFARKVRAGDPCMPRHAVIQVPCRAVPCRAVPCRAVPCRARGHARARAADHTRTHTPHTPQPILKHHGARVHTQAHARAHASTTQHTTAPHPPTPGDRAPCGGDRRVQLLPHFGRPVGRDGRVRAAGCDCAGRVRWG